MMKVVVDSINGISCQRTDTVSLLRAGDIARIAGQCGDGCGFPGGSDGYGKGFQGTGYLQAE